MSTTYQFKHLDTENNRKNEIVEILFNLRLFVLCGGKNNIII